MRWRDFDCPICGGKNSLKEHFYFNSHGDGIIYWECEKCKAQSDHFDGSCRYIDTEKIITSVRSKNRLR